VSVPLVHGFVVCGPSHDSTLYRYINGTLSVLLSIRLLYIQMQMEDQTTPRTVMHDATLKTYDPQELPDFDVFRAVVDESTRTVEQLSN